TFTDILDEMKLQAFAYVAYSAGQRSDPVLGSITSQGLALVQLTEKLGSLVGNLGDDIWLEAAAVIESQIVFAYSANRAVFGGQNGKGLDWLVRPTLEPRIFGNRHHAAAIRRWLRERSSHLPQDLVSDLEKAVEGYFESGDPPRPMSAGHSGPLSSALQERVFSTDPESHAALLRILAHNAAVVERSVTLPILRVIQTVEDVFGGLEDYRVPEVKLAFGNLVFHLASFLERKLDSSVEEDKFSAYLFSDGARKPLEKDLQQDFLRHGRSARLPVESEVKGKGGGRADIRYKSDQHEIIIEVKREERDSSFDNLVRSYGEQTVLYQTTNVKLGVMLVLDISRDHVVWPHMDSLYEARVGDFLNDGTQRGVLIMNIPGRRGTPSDATKRAKSLKSRKSSARKNTFA
ncbi:MAG: hypothetical protein J0H51_16405, partial [Rhizobiales bacterium]|nr:hypothetical protein [Hyphomicrobiales bacterium]